MHEAAFAQAALPAPVAVLGLSLKPYSLGHELFLEREKVEWRRENLPKAVLICASTFEEAKGLHRDWLLGLKLWIWKRRARRFDYGRELEKFLAYRAAGSLEFKISDTFKPGRGKGRVPGSPFLLRLHQFLVCKLGLSEGAAWDYPFGLAKMQWCAFWEGQGGVDVYNEEEAELDRFVAEAEKEEAAKNKEATRA